MHMVTCATHTICTPTHLYSSKLYVLEARFYEYSYLNIKVPHGCCFRLASLELYDQPVRQSREHAGNRLQLPRRAPLRGPTSQLPNLGLHSMEIPEPIGLLRLDTAGHARA